MIVYQITNKVNGKRYIGLTKQTIQRRWRQHVSSSERGARTALANAIRTYGVSAFEIVAFASLIPDADPKELGLLEQEIIAQETSLAPAGYNLSLGGESGSNGYRYTEEQLAARRGRKQSPESIAKRAAALRGRPRPPEVIEKMRASQSHASWGSHTPEAKAKITAALMTPERREQSRIARLGIPLAESSKEKLRSSWTPEKRSAQAERLKAVKKAMTPEQIASQVEKTRTMLVERNKSDKQRKAMSQYHAKRRLISGQ